MFSEVIIRQKLKDLRRNKGLTEEQVANHLGRSSNSSISRIESGQTRLNFEVVQKLCDLYQVNPLELFNSSKDLAAPVVSIQRKSYLERIMFRADSNLDVQVVDRIKEMQPILRKLGSIQSKISRTAISVRDVDPDFNDQIFNNRDVAIRYASSFAAKLRSYLNLGTNSIVDITDICWKYLNIPVCGLELGDNVWGMYSRDRFDNPLIIYSLNTKYQQRNVFTIAHELGHHFFFKENLELDSDSNSKTNDIYEVVANKFAQELLVPMNFLREKYDEFGFSLIDDLQAKHVVQLCNYFKVSFQMMLYCLLQAGKFTPAKYEDLKAFGIRSDDGSLERLGYLGSEYLGIVPSLRERLEEVALIAYRKKIISKLDATSLLDITTDELLLKA
ncbi:MAG: ImmA/IrrE family metallo-endopeptidase [Bacteriovoracaceae bacterium]|nr:ImmA/IrrE family metallo-endopeptidase [Bacteriovoracaceae bacterium]